MAISNLINGINPSIAKIIYYLNFWGIKTTSSHAGFYPGDPEEQEYWIQKHGYEEDFMLESLIRRLFLSHISEIPDEIWSEHTNSVFDEFADTFQNLAE